MRSSGEAVLFRRRPGVVPGGSAGVGRSTSMAMRRVIERLIAVGYGLTYDAVVRGFRPWEALLDEIAGFLARSAPPDRGSMKVLDVACGTGTVALRLAREGYAVVGLDAVPHLAKVARERGRPAGGPAPVFHHLDVARDPVPGAGTFDALVSMHTLYWHPAPEALLAGCYRALRPGGHGVLLTYQRRARVGRTFREVLRRQGLGAAVRALRWLVPTALFERLRDFEPRYLNREEFHGALARAGFEVLESRETFLAGLSLLAWVRKRE
jgi:SAM-dependent methyltransferase